MNCGMNKPENHLTGIERKKEYKSEKKDLFLKYHCSLDIMPVFHFLKQNKICKAFSVQSKYA